MKTKIQFISFYLFLLTIPFYSCKGEQINANLKKSVPELKEKILSNEITLIYVWTDWCSFGDKFLQETYIQNKKKLDDAGIKVLLLCASPNHDSTLTFLKDSLNYEAYYIDGVNSNFPFLNRRQIAKQLNRIFGKIDNASWNEKIGFMVPITFFATKDLHVIEAPQRADDIIRWYIDNR